MKPNLSSRDAMALYTIIEAIAERDNLRAQLAEREEAIENAPHEMRCNCVLDSNGFVVRCDCWKSKALAQINKALSPQQSKTT